MPNTDRDAFLELSSDLTGFPGARLEGTGNADLYLKQVSDRAGAATLRALLETHAATRLAAGADQAAFARALRQQILSDARLGPPARSLLKLWYVGVWHALPAGWHDAYGGALDDVDGVPAPSAYTEGLLWPAVGANPAGAKPHGYGMWAYPPRIPDPRPHTGPEA